MIRIGIDGKMDSYTALAYVYDTLMWDIDYPTWVSYIKEIWGKFDFEPETILDLGCGTGNISSLLYKDGYDVIGVDISEDMLTVAKNKAVEGNEDILYLNQDMCEFELYGTVDCILCLFDSINYVEDIEKINNVFKLAHNYLNPGGLFIFDVNTIYKYENILADNTFSGSFEYAYYIWDNFYDQASFINEYFLTIFTETESGLYLKNEEVHYQKAYSENEILSLIRSSGLKLLAKYDAYTFDDVSENSERIFFVCQKQDWHNV